jgi:hypothetical protein
MFVLATCFLYFLFFNPYTALSIRAQSQGQPAHRPIYRKTAKRPEYCIFSLLATGK